MREGFAEAISQYMVVVGSVDSSHFRKNHAKPLSEFPRVIFHSQKQPGERRSIFTTPIRSTPVDYPVVMFGGDQGLQLLDVPAGYIALTDFRFIDGLFTRDLREGLAVAARLYDLEAEATGRLEDLKNKFILGHLSDPKLEDINPLMRTYRGRFRIDDWVVRARGRNWSWRFPEGIKQWFFPTVLADKDRLYISIGWDRNSILVTKEGVVILTEQPVSSDPLVVAREFTWKD